MGKRRTIRGKRRSASARLRFWVVPSGRRLSRAVPKEVNSSGRHKHEVTVKVTVKVKGSLQSRPRLADWRVSRATFSRD